MRSRLVLSGWVFLALAAAPAACENAKRPPDGRGTEATATAPAATSQPASKIVLVRIGDKAVVTQAEFTHDILWVPEKQRARRTREILGGLIEQKRFELYVREHPELVPAETVEAELDKAMAYYKVDSLQELERALEKKSIPMAEFQSRMALQIARQNLAMKGVNRGKDEKERRKIYEANPDHFNGSRRTVKHILISVPPWATPAERQAARDQIAKIRDDLVAGRRAWSQCVEESHCNTRFNDGLIGSLPRHLRFTEPVATVAWSLKVGELSDIVESNLGFHLVKVTGQQPAYRVEREPYRRAIAEVQKKYPTVGVRAPVLPPTPEPTTKPAPASDRAKPARKPRPVRKSRPARKPPRAR